MELDFIFAVFKWGFKSVIASEKHVNGPSNSQREIVIVVDASYMARRIHLSLFFGC